MDRWIPTMRADTSHNVEEQQVPFEIVVDRSCVIKEDERGCELPRDRAGLQIWSYDTKNAAGKTAIDRKYSNIT
jgi:hypothetical protein